MMKWPSSQLKALIQCRFTVGPQHAGTTLIKHEVNASCLMAGIPGEYRVHTYSTQGLIADIELSALILITRNKVKSKGSNCLLDLTLILVF